MLKFKFAPLKADLKEFSGVLLSSKIIYLTQENVNEQIIIVDF